LKLRVWDYPNPTRQRGIVFLRFGSVSKNPSLTLRVMINHSVFGTMVYLMRGMRNFKTHASGCDENLPFVPGATEASKLRDL
jgi:hypothetical protein